LNRAKWKKRKKTTNVFRSPGALLPSHTLPPFGSMGSSTDSLCSFGPTYDTRWMGTGMSQMPSHGIPLSHSLSRQTAPTFGQSLSVSPMSCNMNQNSNTITTNSGAYHSQYGNTLTCTTPPPNQQDSNASPQAWMSSSDTSSTWRHGTSIENLRRKALEHTVSMTLR
jgi:hypothetical protein